MIFIAKPDPPQRGQRCYTYSLMIVWIDPLDYFGLQKTQSQQKNLQVRFSASSQVHNTHIYVWNTLCPWWNSNLWHYPIDMHHLAKAIFILDSPLTFFKASRTEAQGQVDNYARERMLKMRTSERAIDFVSPAFCFPSIAVLRGCLTQKWKLEMFRRHVFSVEVRTKWYDASTSLCYISLFLGSWW